MAPSARRKIQRPKKRSDGPFRESNSHRTTEAGVHSIDAEHYTGRPRGQIGSILLVGALLAERRSARLSACKPTSQESLNSRNNAHFFVAATRPACYAGEQKANYRRRTSCPILLPCGRRRSARASPRRAPR